MAKVISNKDQLTRLVELVKENTNAGETVLTQCLRPSKWKEIAVELNILGPPTRDWDKWKRVWTDMKVKAKKRGYSQFLHDSTTTDDCPEPKMVKHIKEEIPDFLPTDDSNISVLNEAEPHQLMMNPIKFEEEEITEPNENKSCGDRDDTSMDKNVSAQNEFYQNVKDILNDVKTSLREMEDYTRKSFYLKKDYYDKMLSIKREKLELYKKRHLTNQDSNEPKS